MKHSLVVFCCIELVLKVDYSKARVKTIPMESFLEINIFNPILIREKQTYTIENRKKIKIPLQLPWGYPPLNCNGPNGSLYAAKEAL